MKKPSRAPRAKVEKFFNDDTVYLERYLPNPRHVEVQILADNEGNVIHLGERDCSVQRRHQKLIEEAPAPAVDAELRARIGEIGVNAAKAVNYRGAGTIEGMLQDGEYYFLEMNTRVQVEHCVTEEVTGIDIVKEGIRVAAGQPLSIKQEDVELKGHSIECRINFENAGKNFAPAPGKIGNFVGAYVEPSGPGIRVDSGVTAGSEISPLYDPMAAKLIVWAENREEATKRMIRALNEYKIDATTLDPLPHRPARERAVGQRRDLQGPHRGQDLAQAVRQAEGRPSPSKAKKRSRRSPRPTPSRSPASASTSRSRAKPVDSAAALPRPPRRPPSAPSARPAAATAHRARRSRRRCRAQSSRSRPKSAQKSPRATCSSSSKR